MNLELTHEEKELLREMIDRRLTELGVEIHRTDAFSYRDGLEKEQVMLTDLQSRLPLLTTNR